MHDSKHFLFSKIFMSALVGLACSAAASFALHMGYTIIISPAVQMHIVTILCGLIMAWRARPTKALHVKKPKETYYFNGKNGLTREEVEQIWLKNKGAQIITSDREANKNACTK